MKRLSTLHYHELTQIDPSLTVTELKSLLNYKTDNEGLILEKDNTIIGYVIYEPAEALIVHKFYIDVHYRRSGYGTEMFNELFNLLVKTNRKCLFIMVDETNLVAQLFFKAMGCVGSINKTNREIYNFDFCLTEEEVAIAV